MKNNILTFACFFISTSYAVAQVQLERSVVASGGTFASSPSLTLEYSIGQLVSTTATSGNLILTQGYHQANPLSVSIQETLPAGLVIQVYPNPVASQFYIEFTSPSDNRYTIGMYDLAGRLVESRSRLIRAGETMKEIIEMRHLAPAVYLLNVSDEKQSIVSGSFKIIRL